MERSYITISDVAKCAGVSVSTVSQVINGKGRISEPTRKKIEAAIKELDYIPSSMARTMRSSRSYTVGFLVSDIRNEFFANLTHAVQNTLFASGYSTLIGSFSNDLQQQDMLLRRLLAEHIDGTIIVPQGPDSEALESLLHHGLPVIFVDRPAAGVQGVPLIASDPEQGLLEALIDIRDHGHKKVGFVSGPSAISPVFIERERVFRRFASALFGESNLYFANYDPYGSRDVVREEISRLYSQGVSALIFANSPLSLAGMGAMHTLHLNVGIDISIVSFDDVEVFELITPRISSISQQVEQMGVNSARKILEMIENRSSDDNLNHIDTMYIARESVVDAPIPVS